MSAPDIDMQHPVFVGRRPELERLATLWRAIASGAGRIAIVGGEAGIGKTALVREFMDSVVADGGRVHVGHSYERTPIALHDPWSEILDSIRDSRNPAERNQTPPGAEDEVSRIGWIVSQILPPPDEPPTLLVLEDFQWADAASIEILRHASHQCLRRRLLILLTLRTDDQLPAAPIYTRLPEIVREGHVSRFDLAPLTPHETRELIDRYLALPPASASSLADFLAQHTEGIPLFIAEMIESLRRTGILQHTGTDWELRALPPASGPVPIPELLRQIVEARLQTVEPGNRQNLQFIAVIERAVPVDHWPALFEQSEATIIESIEAGLASGLLLESQRDGHPEFRHALFRRALLAEISSLRRRSLHRQVAEFLVATPEPRPRFVASHFQQAGDPRAFDWLIRAAYEAERGFAMLTAVEYLELALTMLDEGVAQLPQGEHGWLLLRTGSLHRQTLLPASRDYLGEALAIAREVGDRALEVQALWGQGVDVCLRGRNGLAALDEALKISASLPANEREGAASDLLFGMPSDLVIARGVLVVCCAIFGDLERARTYAGEYLAIPVGDARRDRSIAGQVHMGLAFTYEAEGEPAKTQQELRRALELHEEIDSTWGKAVVIQDLLLNTLYFYADKPSRRKRIAAEVERIWQAAEHGVTRLPPRFGLLSALYLYGEWDEARRLAEPFLEDEYVVQALIYPVLASIARYQGRPDDAWGIIAYLLPEGPDTPDRSVIMSYAIPTQHVAIDMALDDEDFELAERWIDAAGRWLGAAGETDAFVFGRSQLAARRGRLALMQGDLGSASRQASSAVSEARDPYQPVALIEALLLAGQCHSAQGENEAAADAWSEALELARDCDAAHLIATVELHLARLDAERGNPDRAREYSTSALATIERLDARLLLRGLSPARAQQPASADLPEGVHITPRELEIARLLVTGKSNREMAGQLSISVRTIERHISNLYEKTGAHGRAAITAYILSNDLL